MTIENEPTPPLPYPGAHQAPVDAQQGTNVLAIVALIAAFFVGLVGVICGVISLSQLKRTGQKGRGLAIAGIVVGAAQLVVMVIVTIAMVAAAASIGTAASAARSRDALPTPAESSISQECADLTERMHEGATALNAAGSNVATDPQSAVQALKEFTNDLRDASEQITNPEVAAAAREATTGLEDFTTYLEGVAADPVAAAAAPDFESQMRERLAALETSLTGVATACEGTP